jgi:alkylation response protein AidB-like acyl-CoA dehydrogenase
MMPPEPGPGEDWYADDPALARLLALDTDAATVKAAEPLLGALGTLAPSRLDALARRADRTRPALRPGAGPGGQDSVAYDASYLELRRLAREHRVFTAAWHPLGGRARAPRTVHFALGYLYAQAEAGYSCPGCMTDGAAFVLARHAPPALRDAYVPRLVQLGAEGAWEGAMLLTERSGGSDLAGTATTATRGADGAWRLDGEKWFASNCTAEVILTLARLPGAPPGTEGLGLFLVPRVLPDGRPNRGIALRKLKDKLGVASMATAELEFQGAGAFLLAGEGRGFQAMAEMVNLSRLYNAVASVAIARRALREGLRNARQREAFGALLLDQPLFRRGAVALAVEVEGALAVVLEAARAMDRAGEGDAEAAALLRALTPLAKACTAKLAVRAASEACEMLGGNGYVEDYVTPRLLRDAQVLPIWEGTTHVQSLDLLRAARRQGALQALRGRADALHAEARREPALAATAADLHTAWDALAAEAARALAGPDAAAQAAAWRLTRALYHAMAASLLARAAAHAGPAARPRAIVVARAYAALLVGPAGAEGERVLEQVALAHGRAVLDAADHAQPI